MKESASYPKITSIQLAWQDEAKLNYYGWYSMYEYRALFSIVYCLNSVKTGN